MASKTLVTSALPYANGPIHLGHLVEYVQTDIYVRFLKSCGESVIYLCADDTHGTPIELNAAKQGVSPEIFIQRFQKEHQRDFADFDVSFDCFHSTHSPENRHFAELIYSRLQAAGDIERKEIEQAYCEKDARFLPDRFIRGTCPNCAAADQYGDACEKCAKAYSPTDLIAPRCALCGNPPVRRRSAHLFFRLSRHAEFLKEQIRKPAFLNPALANQLKQFFDQGLADWDISRDGPYFGFPIPGEQDKFFYVWLDAPIGYIATTEKWAKGSALIYWEEGADTRIIHFIGKDIVYFHALFWPAVLKVARLKRPEHIQVHGHLTIDGEKMSKSRGTLITARAYLDALDPSYLRFFYAANLGSGAEDLDLSLNEFRLKTNAELVNNVGNLANRTLSILAKDLGGRLSTKHDGPGQALVTEALGRVPEIRAALARFEYRTAVKAIVEISQRANQFLTATEPWKSLKATPEIARRDLSDAAEVAYLVGCLLAPIVPRVSKKLFDQLCAPGLSYAQMQNAKYPLLDRQRAIGTPSPLIERLDEAKVKLILEAPANSAPAQQLAVVPEIEYQDFEKVQLRVGKVLAAERVPKADKLLKLTVDAGEGTPRTIAAGIAEAYSPEQLVGRNVVVVTNLKPRMLRGIESKGMLLAAGAGGNELCLVDPGPMPPGAVVK